MIDVHSDVHGKSATVPSAVRVCLLAEEIALDVAGVRDRVLKTGKVSLAIHDDSRDVPLATRWLLGLSNLVSMSNGCTWTFMPFYSPTQGQPSAIMGLCRRGDLLPPRAIPTNSLVSCFR